MKTILIYDTETTGLPIWSKPSDDPAQPHITQLAAELCNADTGETLAYMNYLVKPDGWTIPEDVAAMTGITTEKAEAAGFRIDFVMRSFLSMWLAANVHRVAHNEGFDMRMVRIELCRHNWAGSIFPDEWTSSTFADKWKEAPAFCTCASSINILKLPPTEKMLSAGRNGPKSPNLTEAYKHFTGLDLVNAHNAATDIMACKAVYFGIKKAA